MLDTLNNLPSVLWLVLSVLTFIVPFTIFYFIRMSLRRRAVSLFLLYFLSPFSVVFLILSTGGLKSQQEWVTLLIFFFLPVIPVATISVILDHRRWRKHQQFYLEHSMDHGLEWIGQDWISDFYDIDLETLKAFKNKQHDSDNKMKFES